MPKPTKGTKKPAAAGGRGTGKKSGAAAPSTSKAPAARKTAPSSGDSGGRAFYVLAILVLLTAVVFLANRLYFQPGTGPVKDRPSERHETADAGKKDVEAKKDSDEKKEKKETVRQDKKSTGDQALIPEREVRLYFLRFNEKTEKVNLAYSRRTIRADMPLLGAMQELAKGPGGREEQSGLLSALPGGLVVRGVVIKNRVAHIDFNEALERNAVGSILMNRIDQIVYTATQFEGVEGVVIKINGVERRTIGPDGLALARPLTRAGH